MPRKSRPRSLPANPSSTRAPPSAAWGRGSPPAKALAARLHGTAATRGRASPPVKPAARSSTAAAAAAATPPAGLTSEAAVTPDAGAAAAAASPPQDASLSCLTMHALLQPGEGGAGPAGLAWGARQAREQRRRDVVQLQRWLEVETERLNRTLAGAMRPGVAAAAPEALASAAAAAKTVYDQAVE